MKAVKVMAAVAVSALLLGAPGIAAGKVKRERAQIALPVVVQAPMVSSQTYDFRAGAFWGAQAASYRSAVTVDAPISVPELWDEAVIPSGQPLFELRAASKGFSGKLYCTAQQRNPRMAGTLMCLADRDGDGAMDQIWTGGVASVKFLVPLPSARSVKTIAPVQVRPVDDPQRLALQLGFYVSGANPLFGTHHFYPMVSFAGEIGFPFTQMKNSVTLKQLPRTLAVGGAEIRVESVQDKQYRATVMRPYPSGERLLVGQIESQTIYISVPG
jgi:hypothetical protein